MADTAETEYFELFSKIGELQVQVKFKDHSGTVASLRMNPEEILKLISPVDGQFFSEMSFDEWPFEIYKYEIDPIKKILTIRAGKAKGKREAKSTRPTQARKNWSESARERTRAITDCHGEDFWCPDEKLHLKNVAGPYGYINLTDLYKGVLKVVDKNTGQVSLFNNTEELLDAGWVID